MLSRGNTSPKIVDANAFVLPALNSYVAYVDVDAHEFSLKSCNSPCKLRLKVYSPESLSEGELADIAAALDEEWCRYIFRLEYMRRIGNVLTCLGLIEGAIAIGMIASALFPPYPLDFQARIFHAIVSAFFWGILIFIGTTTVAAIRILANFNKIRGAKRLLRNWMGAEAVVGDGDEVGIVRELRDQFAKLRGTESLIYGEMAKYCKERGYEVQRRFYEWKLKTLIEERSYLLEYNPTTLSERLRAFILGPKISPPKVVVPMRYMGG